jgi:hypothetical protein
MALATLYGATPDAVRRTPLPDRWHAKGGVELRLAHPLTDLKEEVVWSVPHRRLHHRHTPLPIALRVTPTTGGGPYPADQPALLWLAVPRIRLLQEGD